MCYGIWLDMLQSTRPHFGSFCLIVCWTFSDEKFSDLSKWYFHLKLLGNQTYFNDISRPIWHWRCKCQADVLGAAAESSPNQNPITPPTPLSIVTPCVGLRYDFWSTFSPHWQHAVTMPWPWKSMICLVKSCCPDVALEPNPSAVRPLVHHLLCITIIIFDIWYLAHHLHCITFSASPLVHHLISASPSVHHLQCITFSASPSVHHHYHIWFSLVVSF